MSGCTYVLGVDQGVRGYIYDVVFLCGPRDPKGI